MPELIEKLIVGVQGWDSEHDGANPSRTKQPVPGAGFDVDHGAWAHFHDVSIQFHLSRTLQHEVDFGAAGGNGGRNPGSR